MFFYIIIIADKETLELQYYNNFCQTVDLVPLTSSSIILRNDLLKLLFTLLKLLTRQLSL